MPESLTLKKPWLVAVWPGMGHVAVSAGYYLMSKLGMHALAEFSAPELFDVEAVEVKDGLIRPARQPRSRLFAWHDPAGNHDLIVFIGEAQPPHGRYAFCRRLIEYATQMGVERVFTFAAMATQMHPERHSRVFGAATDERSVAELRTLELELLEDGNISGLNGVLLGVAAEAGLRGTCLLGEMPHIFAQFPFPKASWAVLEVFTKISGLEIDFTELAEQVDAVEQRLGEILSQVEQAIEQRAAGEAAEESYGAEPEQEPKLKPDDERRIERMFEQAALDHTKAYELKRELDRMQVFADYEDRFLDLFKKPE